VRKCYFSVSPERVKFLVTTLAVSVCAAARPRAGVCSAGKGAARTHTRARRSRRRLAPMPVHTATPWPRSVGLRSIAGASESSQPAALSFSVSPNRTQLRFPCAPPATTIVERMISQWEESVPPRILRFPVLHTLVILYRTTSSLLRQVPEIKSSWKEESRRHRLLEKSLECWRRLILVFMLSLSFSCSSYDDFSLLREPSSTSRMKIDRLSLVDLLNFQLQSIVQRFRFYSDLGSVDPIIDKTRR